MKKLSLLEGLKACVTDFAFKTRPVFIISDLRIFEVLTQEALRKILSDSADPLLDLEGKGAGISAYETICQGSLFAQVPKMILNFTNKHSVKFWKEEMGWLSQLPKEATAPLLVFLPLTYRAVLPELEKLQLESHLFWAPNQQREILEAAQFLASYALNSPDTSAHSKTQINVWAETSLQHYGSEFEAIYGHFSNMKRTGLNFEDCLMSGTNTEGFELVDCLVYQSQDSLALRLQQCAFNNENPSGIFAAICYFLKQLALVQDALIASNPKFAAGMSTVTFQNAKIVFDRMQIPYPSQSKVFAALSKINPGAVTTFFWEAPNLEMIMRSHKDPFGMLLQQLKKLLHGEK